MPHLKAAVHLQRQDRPHPELASPGGWLMQQQHCTTASSSASIVVHYPYPFLPSPEPVESIVRKRLTVTPRIALGDTLPNIESGMSALPIPIRENWQLIANANLNSNSYLRIFRLASRVDGWRGENSRTLDAGSLRKFLSFMKSVKNMSPRIKEPEFSLVPNGNLQASWYKNKRHYLELEFTSSDEVFFGLFDGRNIIDGVVTIREMIQLMASRNFKPLFWSYAS